MTKYKYLSRTSYTWKTEYCLPYESDWSRIAKFCFLNGLSWYYVKQKNEFKNYIYDIKSDNFYFDFPPLSTKQIRKYNTFNNQYHVYRMCPKCMKHGYHSVLHEIEGLDYCFIHKCKLIEIPVDKFYESRYGTYEFWNVKAEHIIKNKDIAMDVERFIQRRKASNLMASNYFLFKPYNNSEQRSCYKSMVELYNNLYCLQNKRPLHGCYCIYSILVSNIERTNKFILDHIMHHYIGNIKEHNFFYDIEQMNVNELEEILKHHCVVGHRVFYNNDYVIDHDTTLGGCFIAIASAAIHNVFGNLNEWERAVRLFDVRNSTYFEKNNWRKIAIIMAVQAITGSSMPSIIEVLDSYRWTKWDYLINFKLPVYDDFKLLSKSFFNYRGSPTDAEQYIIYPIMKDLFYELVSQATLFVERNIIQKNCSFFQNLNSNIWLVPQYAVFYFEDRVDIYRCEYEHEE